MQPDCSFARTRYYPYCVPFSKIEQAEQRGGSIAHIIRDDIPPFAKAATAHRLSDFRTAPAPHRGVGPLAARIPDRRLQAERQALEDELQSLVYLFANGRCVPGLADAAAARIQQLTSRLRELERR